MQRLHYTGDTILMADATATAVLAYASALAEANASDVVTVPVVDNDGRSTRAELLIGPASQLYAMPAAGVDEVQPDAEVIADLQQRTAKVGPSRPITEETDLSPFAGGDVDLL